MNQRLLSFLVFITILLSTCVWSSLQLGISPWRSVNPILLSVIFLIILFLKKSPKFRYSFQNVVSLSLISLYFSVFTSYVLYKQSPIYSIFFVTQLTYGFFLYFILHKYNFPTKKVINSITVISVVWVILEIVQQFTYPQLWFARTDNPEKRMGLIRLYIWGVDFVMIALCYWWGKITNGSSLNKKKILSLCIVLTVGLLCYASRKHIYATLMVVLLAIINMKGSHRALVRFTLLIALSWILVNFYASFMEANSQLNEMQGGDGEDFIRILEFKYFTTDFLHGPFEYCFGVGIPDLPTSMGRELERLKDMYGFYQSDIGVFGYFTQFGFFGIVPIVMYIFIFLKNWRYIDNQYRYFFLMKLLLIVFDFWAMWGVGMVAWALFMYLVDQNIKENKEKKTKIALI